MSGNEILVGYDGSADASAALEWALEEAGRSGRPVRLAYVFEWLTVAGWIGPGVAPGIWPDETARRQVEDWSARRRRTRPAAHPELTVTGEVFDGPPALVLQERSAQADLLVLGTRGHGGFGGLLVGSTAVAVAAHAHCPVVVIRGESAAGGRTGHVAVGVDGSDCFAAGAGLRLRAGRRPAGAPARGAGLASAGRPASAVGPRRRGRPRRPTGPSWTSRWPGGARRSPTCRSPWRWRRGPRRPCWSMASRNACLVVVGTRGRGGLEGMLLGSVSQQLIQHAHCPVAVVRER